MRIIEKRFFYYYLSLILVLFGAFSFYLFKPRLGIDLIGGQILEVKTKVDIQELANNLGIKISYYPTSDGYLIKSQDDLNLFWQEIKKKDPQSQKIKFESISGSLSAELRKKSFLMIFLVLLAIGAYVAFAFYKIKRYFSLFNLAFIITVTLFHDVIVTTGFYLFLVKFLNFDLDIKFITALLIIAGYSVHDTIVVFDRLRENILKMGKKNAEVFNLSVNQTLIRSIFTSLTVVLSILPLTIFLPDLRAFLISIQIGVVVGTYSSIFLASPLLFDQS